MVSRSCIRAMAVTMSRPSGLGGRTAKGLVVRNSPRSWRARISAASTRLRFGSDCWRRSARARATYGFSTVSAPLTQPSKQA